MMCVRVRDGAGCCQRVSILDFDCCLLFLLSIQREICPQLSGLVYTLQWPINLWQDTVNSVMAGLESGFISYSHMFSQEFVRL